MRQKYNILYCRDRYRGSPKGGGRIWRTRRLCRARRRCRPLAIWVPVRESRVRGRWHQGVGLLWSNTGKPKCVYVCVGICGRVG